jgi:hypothetical protein
VPNATAPHFDSTKNHDGRRAGMVAVEISQSDKVIFIGSATCFARLISGEPSSEGAGFVIVSRRRFMRFKGIELHSEGRQRKFEITQFLRSLVPLVHDESPLPYASARLAP